MFIARCALAGLILPGFNGVSPEKGSHQWQRRTVALTARSAGAAGVVAVRGALPRGPGDRDICFQVTAPTSGPFYAVEKVQLVEDGE